jgi:hypothetical protein
VVKQTPEVPPRREDPPSDFTFLTPSDWFRLRLGDDERAGDVDRLVRDLTRHHPERDSVAPELRAMIESRTRSAGQEDGAIELHLSFSQQDGLPLAAALLVHLSPFPPGSTTRELLSSYAAGGRGAGEVVAHGTGATGRREWTTRTRVDDSVEAESLVVQRLFPSPDSSVYVMLTLSTPLVVIADQMRELFDAICDSFRWIW